MFHVCSRFVWHPVSDSSATCQKVWNATTFPVRHTEYYPSRSTQPRQNIKVSLSSHIHVDNRGHPFTRPSRGALKKALSASTERQVFKNKHAAVPKPFHILKRRQSANLWIGHPGTPVTNVISAWHRGFKPIQPPPPPPTHRPLLRLCHYNPQAGFLSPRWAGDSTCEQNSPARAASRNYYLFLAWQLSLDSRSVVILYVLVWGLGRSASRGLKKNTVSAGLRFDFQVLSLALAVRCIGSWGGENYSCLLVSVLVDW